MTDLLSDVRAIDPTRTVDPADDAMILRAARLRFNECVADVAASPWRPVRAHPSRMPRAWLRVGVPLTAAAAVVAVVAVAAPWSSGGAQTSTVAASPLAPTVTVVPASSLGASALLGHIADVALRTPVPAPTAREFVYVRSVVGFDRPTQAQTFDGPATLDATHERQVWLPQTGSDTGLIREGGRDVTLHTATDDPSTYAALAALPTAPGALLARISQLTSGRAGGTASAEFDWIGEVLRESLAPAPVAAALYRAAALIPGVAFIPQAVDAAGRHGVGVAFVTAGERDEWIFNEHTSSYLGERDYLVEPTAAGPAGTLVGTAAVLQRGVTDRAGVLPGTVAGTD